MFDFAPLAGLVLTSFVATNLDNLLVLVFLLGTSSRRRAAVLFGYLTAVILVVCVAAVGVAAGALIDPAAIGYLGVAPVAMACYLLYQQYTRGAAMDVPEPVAENLAGEGRIWLASSLLMFSNSGDSIAVLLPLLAESSRPALLLIVSLYLVTSLLWCAVALAIAARPGLARRIQQRGARLVPWVMIAVGLYVLLDTRTDTLL
jgi:cadmium resistance protein CadD (predicted permease)